jgi:hypothetical protein
MTIDPKLYTKYTGRVPGDSMTRYGESLAKRAAKGPPGDTSFFGALYRGRRILRVVLAVVALVVIVLFLWGDKIL